jgi:bifunctional DNA-binding transcriptional regulator/antitoxin component of YhaV-PrlF toxin-antitoxin module
MSEIRTRIGLGGRVVIPARYRKKIGVEVGDEVVLVLDGESVRLLTPRQAVKQAQAIVRRYIPAADRLADDLIEDRRREATRD